MNLLYENDTFLLLNFRTSKIEGSITMNGKERNLSLFRKLSAYIMQDNQLHANLTVEEAMNVAANLKLSQKVLRGEKMSVVSKTK
jgi:ATP-binding cassette, subfamily G (WHITE), member 1